MNITKQVIIDIFRSRECELGTIIVELDEAGKVNSQIRKIGEARLDELKMIKGELLKLFL